jgi:4-hydroxy-tetrahydrodipicolinate reductase
MKIALHGATGRMGQAITRLIVASEDLSLVGACCAPNDPARQMDVGLVSGVGPIGVLATEDIASALLGADMLIDFSVAAAVPRLLPHALRAGIPLVSGTTALDPATVEAMTTAARTIPVLWAPNTSLGVHVLAEVVEHAIRRLGPGFDVEIVETHHRRKADSPSGTAKRLAEAARAARPELWDVCGREGMIGARTDDEIGVLALRGGDVIGDHTVHLLGLGERLELTHRVTSRDLLANGALRAARFLATARPGRLYRIADVLGGVEPKLA